MGDPKTAKVPYDERSDDKKLEANWKKVRGQFKRHDWSACIVRVATSAEIAANIFVRQFLVAHHSLPPRFVDALLLGANGLDGKFKRLIKPAAEHLGTWNQLKSLQGTIELLNDHRNGVTHSGKFKSKQDAKVAFELSLKIIQTLAPQESSKLALPYKS
ncbi:MAG TPA: hypothetical protein VJ727_02295 [Rhodanobacteraceae bacterium]|nr:hypothetical protein [Rhodanobacteraceae bacterium]